MTTAAWWHCFSGIAGDMALGSLVDAGASLDLIDRELAALSLGGWALEASDSMRAGLACTQVRVRTPSRSSDVVRTYSHIVGLLTEARLAERVRSRALAVFERLASVEGQLHRRPMSQVHFHEVGSTDAIIDILGTCAALEILGVDEVRSSPVAQGTGMVHSAHGVLPVPAPAVVALLEGAPTYGTGLPMELTTPTGAALLSALCSGWGPMPAMSVVASGYGAGSRELDDRPNVVQVVVGTLSAVSGVAGAADGFGHPVVVLEANVDDVTGEILGSTLAALMGAGALDAWVTPVTGKKGRPAHVVSVLCDMGSVAVLRQVLADETGTLGMRASTWERWPAAREFTSVEVEGYPVRVKKGPRRIKAEHDDAARVAKLLRLPVREVARRAEESAHRVYSEGSEPNGGGGTAGDDRAG